MSRDDGRRGGRWPRGGGHGRARRAGVVAIVAVACALGVAPGACERRVAAQVPAREGLRQLAVRSVGSNHVRLEWPRLADASAIRVLIGPEPAVTPDGTLPGARRVGTLSGDETSWQLDGVAAAAHVFLRVEADTPSGRTSRNLHVQIPGPGPRASLESPVREVHMVAPDRIQIVVAGEAGRRWTQEPWTVERVGGGRIAVRDVSRHSIPVAQPRYEIGFGKQFDDTVDIDHRIVLHLASPIGERALLKIEGPFGVSFLLPFSDRWLETPVVQLNQVGYNPRARKRWAYVSGWLGTSGALPLDRFPANVEVLRDDDGAGPRNTVIATLPIQARARQDADAGAEVRQIDLSSVTAAEGVALRIRVPGVGVSVPTQISEIAATKAFWVIARGIFHNRWAGDLRPQYTDWSRPPDHTTVWQAELPDPFAFAPENTPKTRRRRLRGGFHDAGDFDQRPMHTAVPQLLMRAYEVNPDAFTDGQLSIPESGNGIPDILDEALWGLSGWEQLQEADGGVRAGVESHREPWGIYLASDDPLPYWTRARDAQVSARVAGAFAQASRLIARFDGARARRLRGKALEAWQWARTHGAKPQFMLYATSELARLTGEARFKQELERLWPTIGPDGPFSNWSVSHLQFEDYAGRGAVMPDYVLGYLGSQQASPALLETSTRRMTTYAEQAVRATVQSEHGHRSPRGSYATDWGQGTITARYMDPVIARLQLGGLSEADRQRYFDALSLAADYVLGGNPLGLTFVTGLGSRHPDNPLHLDSLVWIKRGQGAVPGIPVYGPVQRLPAADYYEAGKSAFFPAFESLPPMLRYGDIQTFVTTNEFGVWDCQAPLTELFGVLLGRGAVVPRVWRAGQRDHRSPLPTLDSTETPP